MSGLALLVLPSPAQASQLDAGDRPVVRGPLDRSGRDCQTYTQTDNEGQVVADLKSCLFFYSFDASSETDDQHDYGVAWVQSNVDPAAGWCVLDFRSNATVPSEAKLTGLKPRGTTSVSDARRFVTSLRVDAARNATTNGKVRQGFTLYPDTFTTRTVDNRRKVRVTWDGSTDEMLAFASGYEIRWAQGTTPDLDISIQFDADFEQKETC